jgi:hypothetical protein
MLGRKTFTPDEIERARRALDAHLGAVRGAMAALDAGPVRDALERESATTALLALDRAFVHRVRVASGKDANPVNEVELLVESLLDHGGVLTTNKVIKYSPEQTVLGVAPGAEIVLSVDDLERLGAAFFPEMEKRFRDDA